MPTIDAPPRWLEAVLAEHHPAYPSYWCKCSFKDLDANSRPKKFISCTPAHQAAEVHKALGESILSLFRGGT